jgi:hypothetical protein
MLAAAIEAPIEPVSAAIEMLRGPLAASRVGTLGGTVQASIGAIAAHVQALLHMIPAAVQVPLDAVPAVVRVRLTRHGGLIGGCRTRGEQRYESQSHYSLSHGVLLVALTTIFSAKNARPSGRVDAARFMSIGAISGFFSNPPAGTARKLGLP